MFEQRAPASIDQLLDAFARETSLARHPAMHDRVRVVRAWLSVYLLAGVEPLLTSAEAARLQAARRFEPSRALTGVFGADVLLRALPGFLEPRWRLPAPADAWAQARLTEVLCDWLVAFGHVDAGARSTVIYQIADAGRRARAAVRLRSPGTGARQFAPLRPPA